MHCILANSPRQYRNAGMFARGCDGASRADWKELWRRFEIPGPFMREIHLTDQTLELGFRLPSAQPPAGIRIEPFNISDPDPQSAMTIDMTEMVMKTDAGNSPLREVWKSFTVNVLGGGSFMSEYLFYQIKHSFPAGKIYVRPLKGKLWIDIPLSQELKRQIPEVFVRNEPSFQELIRQIQEAQRTANDYPVRVGNPLQIPYTSPPVLPGWGHPFGTIRIGDGSPAPVNPGDVIYNDNTLWVARSTGLINSGMNDMALLSLVNSFNGNE